MAKIFVFVEMNPDGGNIYPPLCAAHPTRTSITGEEWQAILDRAKPVYEELFDRFKAVSDQVDEEMRREGLEVSDISYTRDFHERLRTRGLEPFRIRQAIAQVLREEGFEVIEDVGFFIYQDPIRVREPV